MISGSGDDHLGQRIADVVVDKFLKLNSKAGKPSVRSNGVKEWTVLASMVMIKDNEVIPLCLTTGVKSLPEKVRTYSQGLMVHDMHAEILCIRSFNRFLMEECLKDGEMVVRTDTQKFKFKDDIKLALFISEPPCGDASMNYLILSKQDNTPWKDETPETKRRKVIRGRSHFDKLGIVRTKPGRLDSVETLSKSCSDKLCIKQSTGLNNSVTSELFDPIFLDYLVLRSDKFHRDDLARCFKDRFAISIHDLEILTYEEDNYPFHKAEGTVPSPNSLVYIDNCEPTIHVLNNGVKIGSYVKNKPPKKGGESILCNHRMIQDASKLLDLQTYTTYIEFKNSQERRKVIEKAKNHLENWVCTGIDDFSI